jgi:hypothetical protein
MIKWKLAGLVVVAALIGALAFTSGSAAETAALIKVAYIDLGQGDSALLQDSGNFDILIDGGKTTAGPVVVGRTGGHRTSA